MKLTILSLFIALFAQLSLAKTTAEVTLEIEAVDRFQQQGLVFSGTRSSGVKKRFFHVEDSGEILFSFADTIGEAYDELNNTRMTVVNSTLVKYEDLERASETKVSADVKGKLSEGNIDSIKIDKAQLKKIILDRIKDDALDTLASFYINLDEALIDYDVDLTDYDCSNNQRVLSCNSKLKISLTIITE